MCFCAAALGKSNDAGIAPKQALAACTGHCSPCPEARGQLWGTEQNGASFWGSQQAHGVMIHNMRVRQPRKIPPVPVQGQPVVP